MAENVYAIWARAAVNVALRALDPDKAEYELRRAASLHPQAITDKIAVLKKQIALLRRYLPKESNDER